MKTLILILAPLMCLNTMSLNASAQTQNDVLTFTKIATSPRILRTADKYICTVTANKSNTLQFSRKLTNTSGDASTPKTTLIPYGSLSSFLNLSDLYKLVVNEDLYDLTKKSQDSQQNVASSYSYSYSDANGIDHAFALSNNRVLRDANPSTAQEKLVNFMDAACN